MEDRQHWQDLLTALVGGWLIASIWVLDFSAPTSATATGANLTTADFVGSGLVALVVGVAALLSYRMWEEWVSIVLGLWLVASPWVLHFDAIPNALWNAVTGGILIGGAAAWNLIEERQGSAEAGLRSGRVRRRG